MSAHGTDNHHHGHNETINFTGPGYYGNLSSYANNGFNFGDTGEYVNATYWERIQTEWCDTGFQNVTAASKGAVGCGYFYEYGLMESANLMDTFTLRSLIAASAWSTDAVWDIKSYTYANGSFSLKASDSVTLSQTAQTINFAKLGKSSDFKNISAVFFELQSYGGAGNTCSYGAPTYGVQIVLDHVKVHWNGKIPTGHGELLSGRVAMAHAHHVVAASLLALIDRNGAATGHAGTDTHSAGAAHHDAGCGYHSMLTSLDAALGHDSGHGLTSQCALPQIEHFGS